MRNNVENRKVITLDNGLRVVCINKDNFKTSSVRVKVSAGSLHEDVPGVAHFFEHICFQGTVDFPTQKILNDYSDKHAIYKNAYTNQTDTVFSADGLELDSVLHVATQLAFHPLLNKISLDKERDAVIDEARANQFSPGIKAKQKQWSVLGGERFSKLVAGTIEEIDQITHEQLIDFHKKYYKPQNTFVVICSDKPVDEQIECLEKYINVVKEQTAVKPKKIKLPWLKSTKLLSLAQNELDEQSQSHINLYYEIKTPVNYREYLLEVTATNVLSYTAHRYLREHLVLAYGASAYVTYIENNNFGISEEFQSFTLSTSVAGHLVSKCIEELKKVPSLAIEDVDLINNKIYSTRYNGALDQEANAISSADSAVRSVQIKYDGEYAPSKFVEIVQSFTVEDVQKEIINLTKNLKLVQVTSPSKEVLNSLKTV